MARRKDPIIPDVLLDQLLAGSHAKAAFDRNSLQTAIALCPRMGLGRVQSGGPCADAQTPWQAIHLTGQNS